MAAIQRWLPRAGLLVMVLLAGCKGPPPKPLDFQNKLVEFNEKLFTIGRSFRTGLYPEDSKDILIYDAAKVRRAQEDAEKAVKEIRQEFNDLDSPRKSPNGQKLRDEYEKFLVVQETIAKEYMKQIVEVVEDSRINPVDRNQRVLALLKKIEEDERVVATDLIAADKEFAKDHYLSPGGSPTLVKPPAPP